MSSGLGLESLRLMALSVCSVCFVPVVTDVGSQLPAAATVLASCSHVSHHDELLALWSHQSSKFF